MENYEAILHSNLIGVAQDSDHPRLTDTDQPDLLCFSHLRWDFVTQRPHHILRRAARDRRVFYWEEPIWHREGELPLRPDGSLGLHLEVINSEPSLWVIRPHITWGIDFEEGQRGLLDLFVKWADLRPYILWYYTPMAHGFSSHLVSAATVYDCMDELAGFLGAPPEISQREQNLFAAADVVFTGGISLFEAKQQQHSNVYFFPSSIDIQHFAKAKGGVLTDPSDQTNIPHPRAGFYGVVDERFDLELLSEVAILQPRMHFVILGPVVKINPSSLPSAANIHYLGGKSYEQLPHYLAGWDVAIIPFALNEATRFISPTKTPEYLASGKPVVSTPIRDVVRSYGEANLVAIAATPADFAAALDLSLRAPTFEWTEAVSVVLEKTSWDATWSGMNTLITLAMEARTSQNSEAFQAIQPTTSLLQSVVSNTYIKQEKHFDYLIVGAGFAGSVLAERLASAGNRVMIIDQRDHIAGNAYDHFDEHGILVHKYGPHIFHTNSDKIVNYLSRFTKWRSYEHRVLSSVDGQLVPVPINLDTINRLYNLRLDAAGMKTFLAARTIPCLTIRTSEDVVMSRVGRDLYEKFFRNYTKKQWGLDPSQLDASVAGRIPVRFDNDDRYFSDTFQAMPLNGYTSMFERMLHHPLITVRTGVSYQELAKSYPRSRIVYTGPIDEYFDFKFGPLPYRSLRFIHQTHDRVIYQSAPVVNYPNDHEYTRITEFKYLTGQRHSKTSIVYEYPSDRGDPYYPIPRPENTVLFAKYRELAKLQPQVTFCGRLANYRYLNMDQVVAQALTTFCEMTSHSKLHIPSNKAIQHSQQIVQTTMAKNGELVIPS